MDTLVQKAVFPSRSKAINDAIEEKLTRLDKTGLARECGKPDPKFEKALAEENLLLRRDPF